MGVTSPRSPSRATQAESIRGPALVVLSAVLYAIGNVFSKSLYNHHMSQVPVFLFRAIIKDLFPGVKEPVAPYAGLEEQLALVIKETGLQQPEEFTIKCIQLYEMTVVPHGTKM